MSIEHTKNIIETLYPINRCLLGEGYDNALKFINHLIPLEILEFPSGTELGTWTVPDEWIVRDAWVKYGEDKILDYKKNPLSLVVGSLPFNGFVSLPNLKNHIHTLEEAKDSTPYVFKYYDKDWGFCAPKTQIYEEIDNEQDLKSGNFVSKWKDKLEGEEYNFDYEVFIDTEYKPGVMKLGVHTIKGKSDREILLFAHLDHPYQANDNLSAVACLIDLAKELKSKYTIKIVFCPETIGSIAYALTQDLSKVEFMIAVDICGNENTLLLQKSFDPEHKINRVAHLAIHSIGESYRKGAFRNTIGSDEYVFNDPQIGVQGIMLSTHPYKEYHTDGDTPEKINYEQIEKVGTVIKKIIDIWEKDFIPVKKFKGQLMRSKYGIQTSNPQVNLSWDYFFYNIDGKRTLAELVCDYGLDFDYCYNLMEKLIEDDKINRIDIGKKPVKKTSK